LGLKECFNAVKKEQGIAVRKYEDINEEYEEVLKRSKAKSYVEAKGGKNLIGKSRAVSMLIEEPQKREEKYKASTMKKKTTKSKPAAVSYTSVVRSEEQSRKQADF
jgi:hypothetical protein